MEGALRSVSNDDGHGESMGQHQRTTARLNTNMDPDLQHRLDIRRAMGHGTKTQQLDEATRIYLALFEGYGEVTPKQLDAMERLLEKKRKH